MLKEAIANFVDRDSGADTDPDSSFWADAPRIVAEGDFYGEPETASRGGGHRSIARAVFWEDRPRVFSGGICEKFHNKSIE